MNEVECWIYLDGPEPERLGQLLDAMRELPPLTLEAQERMDSRAMAAIDAWLDGADPPSPTHDRGGSHPPSTPAPSVARPPLEPAPWQPSAPSSLRPSISAPASVTPPPSAGMPPVVRQPANLASTAPAAVPDGTRTPSVPPPKSGTPAHGPALKTQELPVYVEKNGMKETAPLGDNRFAIALSAIPFAGNTVGTATVHIPPMSLAQFAEFQAELAFWPTYPDWVRSRHQVAHEAAHRALNEHWQKHFADHPEDWPAYARAFAECTERLQGPGSRR